MTKNPHIRRFQSRASAPAAAFTGRHWIATLALLALLLTGVPAIAQEGAGDNPSKDKADGPVVNINTADADQLALLPRVGPALSERILAFREENGEFENPEDLILVRGIGDKTFEQMEPYVVVSGETTLTEKVRSGRTSDGGRAQ